MPNLGADHLCDGLGPLPACMHLGLGVQGLGFRV